MYCTGAKGSRQPCEEVIPVVRGYSGAGEKQMDFLSYKLGLENSQDRIHKNSAHVTNKRKIKGTFPGQFRVIRVIMWRWICLIVTSKWPIP